MKKFILLFITMSISALALTPITCPTNYSNTNLGNCSASACFSENLYTNQSYQNLYDTITVTSAGKRLVYFDETGVDWRQLNENFTITSSLDIDRTAEKGFKRSILPAPLRMGWFDSNSNRKVAIFQTGDTNIKYVESSGGITFIGPKTSALPSMKNIPMWRITYDLASHDYTNDVLSNTIDHHIQCVFVYPKWCGDGDITNNEQCDDGNTTNGDGCSNTCIDEPDPVCNNLSLSPTTMTNLGGNITATCSASNATGYKFLLKRGTSVIETRNYLTSPTATFTLPGNTSTNALGYTVECYVQGGGKSEITSASCDGSIVVPETPAVCNTLTLSHTTVQTNVPVMYTCSATNATSYTIKRGSEVISSLPEGTMNFSTPGTYSIGCFINGKTDTPVSCAKSIVVTEPPVNTIPSIFIDKDDSTPGTPDSDGNDIQRVQKNGTATFTVRVVNNGNEPLKNVIIEDTLASDCARTAAQTAQLYSGGQSANFDVGETFNYQCTKNDVTDSTFTNNRNTASVKGVGVTSGANVTDSDVTEIFLKQTNPSITVEKNDTDDYDDEQEIDEGETARFSIEVTNDGDESLKNVIMTDDLSRDCQLDESETRELIREVGNKDSSFDPGEKFEYTCRETSVTVDTFPDEINTICVDANGVDTDKDVNDCDDTTILVNEDTTENPMCYGIDSSEGTFGGAPFRTIISCDVEESSSCIIEVTKDGEVINEYNTCTRSITFPDSGDYTVACIVDDDRSSDCEMEISVESMTDIPTGTKLFFIAFLSLILTAIGMHMYKKRSIL